MRGNDSGMCEYCIKNIKIKSLLELCEEIVNNDRNDERLIDNYNLYGQVIAYNNFNICSDNEFKKIKIFINKHNMTLSNAISALKNLYVLNNGLYFTAKQAKELVKKQWDTETYRWHNILVFMCLEIYDLDVKDFTCGICYFANFGDKFTPFSYVTYINKRGFDIENKKSFF
jgi:DNA-directed RNA polymerase